MNAIAAIAAGDRYGLELDRFDALTALEDIERRGPSRRREFCHFDDTPLHIPVETPTKGRGGGAAE